jgi:hypothetical protein
MRTSFLLVAVLLVGGLAGCISSTKAPSPAAQAASEKAVYDAIEKAIGEPIDDHGYDTSRPAEMYLNRTAAVNGSPGRTRQPAEGYVETAVKGGYAYLCRTGPDEGLVIFDVHDIEHPVQVGAIKLDAGFEADIEVSDDGHWAFWETQRLPGEGTPDPSNPGSAPGAAPYGIHIVDISDKAHPKWAGFTPVAPNGAHSITYATINGQGYLFASVYSWQYIGTSFTPVRVAPPGMQRLVTYKLDTSLPAARLVEVATYIDPDAVDETPIPKDERMPHDVSVSVHPVTNKTYAYVAYWNLGVVILDVSDPAHPTKIGQALKFGLAPTKEIHMARQSEHLIDGKVILVAEPEISGQNTTGYMSVIDVTDPTAPAFLSNWKIPGNATSGGGGRGPHYFDFANGRVVMASYSAGFWVFDIHDHANLLKPRTVGYAMVQPGASSGLPGPLGGLGGGSAFDAWWADPTHVVAGETSNGLVVFRYTGPTPAIDAPATNSAN